MRFSILIPIYNRLAITKQGLASLEKALNRYRSNGLGLCQFEVVIIDDGSTDGSSEWIARNYPSYQLLRGTGHLWWSGAINKGAIYSIQQLNPDYLLLWNDDVEPADDYFLKIESLYSSGNISDKVIGSKIIANSENGEIWSVGGQFNRLWGRYGMYKDPGANPGDFFECDWLPGMGTIVPASVIRINKIYWDEKHFPQYHGDSDFTLRCKAEGFKIMTCLDLAIYNNSNPAGPKKSRSFKDLWNGLVSVRSIYNVRKRVIFYRRHGIWPFCSWSLLYPYAAYFGSFFKRKILNS